MGNSREWSYIPKSTNDQGAEVDNPKASWTNDEKTKVVYNFRAKHQLACALSRIKFHKIAQCQTGKEIWDTLIESHDDTDQIKESKINILIHQYEFFKMQEYESMEEMISRFIVIINDHKSLGKM